MALSITHYNTQKKIDAKKSKAAHTATILAARQKKEVVAVNELFRLKKFSHATTKLDTGRKKVASAGKTPAPIAVTA